MGGVNGERLLILSGKDVAWATAQGEKDRKASAVCRKLNKFIGTYDLPSTSLTRQMWDAYRLAAQTVQPNPASRTRGQEKNRPAVNHPKAGASPPQASSAARPKPTNTGVDGDGVDSGVGGIGVQDEPERAGGGVVAGQGDGTLGTVARRTWVGEPGAVLEALAEL
jgi:hypothetical protein